MANQKNKGRGSRKPANTNKASRVTPMVNQGNIRTVTRPRGPRITTTDSTMVIRNKEYFGYISSETGVNTIGRVGINPADQNVLPWLAAIANRYTYYRWKKLRVLYTSNCPTTQRGTITIGIFYDLEDLNAWFLGSSPVQNLTQVVGSTVGPVWGSTITCHPNGDHSAPIQACVDVQRAHIRTKWHLIDNATASTAVDNQSVACYMGTITTPNGASAGLGCGEIWFDYEVEFMHPTCRSTGPFVAADRSRGLYDPMTDIRYDVPQMPPRPEPPVVSPTREYITLAIPDPSVQPGDDHLDTDVQVQ